MRVSEPISCSLLPSAGAVRELLHACSRRIRCAWTYGGRGTPQHQAKAPGLMALEGLLVNLEVAPQATRLPPDARRCCLRPAGARGRIRLKCEALVTATARTARRQDCRRCGHPFSAFARGSRAQVRKPALTWRA
jgi:hypothetical protein